jgi:hypothetical protein
MLLRRSSTGRHRPSFMCTCQPEHDLVRWKPFAKLTKQAQHPVAAPAPAPLFFCGCWT